MKKVLVVDDDITTRRIITHAMESAGFCVFSASDGVRALNVVEDNPDLNLIVTDMQMPIIDGRELIGKLSSLEPKCSIPVIIVSGIISLNQISDLLEAGADRFLPKPIVISQLIGYATDLT